jgi:hypothetical protein
MPEVDGTVLPSEHTHFHLQGIEAREPKADHLLNIGLMGLNKGGLPFVVEPFAFATANKNYEEAVESYRYGMYWAAMVMARATIEAALFTSKYLSVDTITGYAGEGGGSMGGHWNLVRKQRTVTFEPLNITIKIDAQARLGAWKNLREEAKALGFSFKEINRMDRLRDRYGNFSAHNVELQMEENQRYANLPSDERATARKPKWAIREPEAYYILEQTGRFLASIRRKYANRAIELLASVQSSTHTSHL